MDGTICTMMLAQHSFILKTKTMATINLSFAEKQEYFHNSLCNGLTYIYGYNLELVYDPKQYKEAKKGLKSPCFEDVLMQILHNGGTLTLHDNEGNVDDSTITLNDMYERMDLTPYWALDELITENDDAETADAVLQTVFFKEIRFS